MEWYIVLGQVAINSNTYHGYSLEETIKGASEAGFSQIEIAAVRDHTSHVLPDMSEKELLAVKQMLKDYGMTCIGVSAHSNLLDTEGVANLVKSIKLAEVFECDYIASATGDSHDDADVIEDQSILVENLQPVLKKCVAANKTLVLETHGNNFATGASILSLIESVEKHQDHLRINYDTGNVIFYGDTEPYEDLERTVGYVDFIHLKDKKGADDEWDFPAIGDGKLDYQRIVDILKEGNFTGPISVEIEFTPAGPEGLEEVNRSVQRSYQYLEKLFK